MNVPQMTLLDWFAGQALSGMLSSEGVYNESIKNGPTTIEQDISTRAYQFAKSMMDEREKYSQPDDAHDHRTLKDILDNCMKITKDEQQPH